MKKIDFYKHNIDKNDRERINRVLRSIFLTTGKEVEIFEQKFSQYIGQKYTVGVTSCTAALHLSLLALGIGPGDEVITSPMSFCATSNAILHAGAKPVFIDVEKETGNVDADLIESKINEKTKAIIPVHLYGQMCNMKKIKIIADTYKLSIIEDAAHAIEASRDNIRIGDVSHAVCFSFYATKNITSGEGGAISTNNRALDKSFRSLRLHGIDKGASERYTRTFTHWDMPVLGWKYNMDNIQAALLIGQLRRIDSLWKKRDKLWNFYVDNLGDCKDIRLLKTLPGVKHARHLFTVLVPPKKRDTLLKSLQKRGIGVAVNYRPIHLLAYYRETLGYREGDYPCAEEIGKCTISLPLYPSLDLHDARHVVQVLKEELTH